MLNFCNKALNKSKICNTRSINIKRMHKPHKDCVEKKNEAGAAIMKYKSKELIKSE